MINKYWFFCVSIALIGNHAWGMDSASPRNDDNNKQIITIPGQKAQWDKLKQLIHELDVPTPQYIESDIAIWLRPPPSYYSKFLPIFEAIGNNDLKKVKEIIEDVDTYNQLEGRYDFGTPLTKAVRGNQTEIARYLIDMGASIYGDPSNPSLLHLANSIEMIELLISAGAQINSVNEKGENLLDSKFHCISDKYEIAIALELIKYGARFDKEMKKNIMPYTITTISGIYNLIYKALLFAFESNNKECAQHFLKMCKIKNIFLDRFFDGKPNILLHYLVHSEPKKYRNAKVKLLLTYCPYLINKQNIEGNTPLLVAMMEKGDNALVSLLLRYGADINLANKNGETPWDFALVNLDSLDMFTRAGRTKLVPHETIKNDSMQDESTTEFNEENKLIMVSIIEKFVAQHKENINKVEDNINKMEDVE